MKPQDIDAIVRLLREEASEISSKDYARIMMREAAMTIVALVSELAARDEQARTARADAERRGRSTRRLRPPVPVASRVETAVGTSQPTTSTPKPR